MNTVKEKGVVQKQVESDIGPQVIDQMTNSGKRMKSTQPKVHQQNFGTDQGCLKGIIKERGNSDEDSEDQGLKIEDIISADGDHLIFGDFSSHEVRSLYSLQLQENRTSVINEYGSNMVKSKRDPLVIIEAKNALVRGRNEGTTPLEQVTEKVVNSNVVPMVNVMVNLNPDNDQDNHVNPEEKAEETFTEQEDIMSYSQEIERDFASISDPKLAIENE